MLWAALLKMSTEFAVDSSGLLQLSGQPLASYSPHDAGLALDATLAAAPFYLASRQPFPADPAPLFAVLQGFSLQASTVCTVALLEPSY